MTPQSWFLPLRHSHSWLLALSLVEGCSPAVRKPLPRVLVSSASINAMYAQQFQVNVIIRGQRKLCPLEWLDQFCMRNFTNSADFDDTLPVADGRVEASFRLTPARFAEGLSAWLTQRGKGEGQPVLVEVTALETVPKTKS